MIPERLGVLRRLPVGISLFMPERSTRLLRELHDWMARENATIMAVVCLVIGAKPHRRRDQRARRLSSKARKMGRRRRDRRPRNGQGVVVDNVNVSVLL